MPSAPDTLVQTLLIRFADCGLRCIDQVPAGLPPGLVWRGGLEHKTLNRHYAVCMLELVGPGDDLEAMIEVSRVAIGRALGARFWRGLGLGLFLFSKLPFSPEALSGSVYTATKASTTIVQWIASVSTQLGKVNVSHTFTEVSSTAILREGPVSLGIPEAEWQFHLVKPVSIFKARLW